MKESMKSLMIYSGKGGVGKTTTTANIAKALVELGYRVFILDADVNTPSMNVAFPVEQPEENLKIASLGYANNGMIYIAQSMIRQYLSGAIKSINKFKPDYLLIDTPPSITDVHINLLEKLKISGLIMVTQPTSISRADVNRTAQFFQDKKINIIGVIENMVSEDSEATEYAWKILARVPFEKGFNMEVVYNRHRDLYTEIAENIENLEEVIQENIKRGVTDESKSYEDVFTMKSGRYGQNKNLRFVNLGSWEQVREELMDSAENNVMLPDRLLDESTYERVARLVNAFEHDEQAYFLITNAPSTEIPLFAGEIGQCALLIGAESYYGIPRVKYQTKNGEVHLFPHECMPITADEMIAYLKEGYVMLGDGRYLPPKETMYEIEAMYGHRVGLRDDWEELYDKLLPETKQEIATT